MARVFVAFYKGRKSGSSPKALLFRGIDWLIRRATRGQYSHCEIAVARADDRFVCYSASLRDGGVRRKTMALPADKWDLVPISDGLLPWVELFYRHTQSQPYDLVGALGVVIPVHQRLNKWFCSEWVGHVLGISESHRLSPNTLFSHRARPINDKAAGVLSAAFFYVV